MKFLKTLSFLLCVVFALSMAACAAPADTPDPTQTPDAPSTAAPASTVEPTPGVGLIPGVYTGSARGMYGDITVAVTVDETSITDIEVQETEDTRILVEAASRDVPARIIASQSLEVDVASGATMSSYGIINAVKNALEQAGGIQALTSVAPPEAELKDEEFDIVIVGAGGAGMAAAIQAKRSNPELSVVLLEKLAATGGSTALSGGLIVIGGTTANEGQFNFTPEEYLDFYIKRANEQSRRPADLWINEELILRIGESFSDIMQYLLDEGLPVVPLKAMDVFDAENKRGLQTFIHLETMNGMYPFCDWMTEFTLKHDVDLRTNSKVTALLQENGAVTGVTVQTPEGEYDINAQKVILATGGYSSNLEMLQELNSEIPNIDKVFSYATAGATGDYFALTESLEPAQAGYGYITMGGHSVGYGHQTEIGNVSLKGFALWINQEGKRFVNERISNDKTSLAILHQKDGVAFGIADSTSQFVETMDKAVSMNMAWKADTLEDLAQQIGVDPEALTATVEQYNADQKAGEDTQFGLPVDVMTPILEPPFYAQPIGVQVVATMQSLKCNENCEILKEDGSVIPNLYGAGEVIMGNLFFQEYVGPGNAIACAINTGYIAAKEAAASLE